MPIQLEVGLFVKDAFLRRGVSRGLLERGFSTCESGSPQAYLLGAPRYISRAGLIVDMPEAIAPERMAELLMIVTGLAIVAVMDPSNEARMVLALNAGVSGVVSSEGSADQAVLALEAAMHGAVQFPIRLGRSLASLYPIDAPGPDVLDEAEVRWLGQLRTGQSISAMARLNGFSEGHMRRRLRLLYARMRVGNREEAVRRAEWWGVLAEAPAQSSPARRPTRT